MSTLDLINAATAARFAFDQATQAAQTAAQVLRDAATAMQNANQALHDDLEASGPCVVVDQSTSPMTVLLYSAADPDSYSVTEIRIAA